jgi:glutathione S-transferase
MSLTLDTITFDCADPKALAAFWAAALGMVVEDEDDEGAFVLDPTGERKRLFFQKVPAPVRPIVVAMVRRKLRATLHGHGIGRHSRDEIAALGTKSINAIADFLAHKPFFFGPEPTGADATMFAFTCAMLCPHFESPIGAAAERRENLRRYVGRMTARFYPGMDELAGCKAAA